jgi:tripartite-type tricarboxylate transporter receptor subunit TctC
MIFPSTQLRKSMLKRALSCLACLFCIAFMPGSAWAQARTDNFPSRPVSIIVGVAPGGPSDADVRIWSQPLTEALGKPFVMDFKPGAGGIIASNFVAKAAPDGHTLLYISGGFTTTPAFNDNLPFDPVKDFAPLSLLSKRGTLLVVTPSLPVRNFAEYLAYAKANPGALNWGTSGVGSTFHMTGAWLGGLTATRVTFIHYKGNAQNFIDLTAGRVQVSPMSLFAALPFIKAGKVRPIAQLSLQRSTFLPDLPTVAEQGVPGFDYFTWQGFILPTGTPAALIARLHAPLAAYAKNPEAVSRAAKDGSELIGSPPETLGQVIAEEIVRWKKVVKENNIKPEE